jgi:hypothetical protein
MLQHIYSYSAEAINKNTILQLVTLDIILSMNTRIWKKLLCELEKKPSLLFTACMEVQQSKIEG